MEYALQEDKLYKKPAEHQTESQLYNPLLGLFVKASLVILDKSLAD